MRKQRLRVDLRVAVLEAADVQRPEATLVVRGDGHLRQDPLDLLRREALLVREALAGAPGDQLLRARTGRHPGRRDPDELAGAAAPARPRARAACRSPASRRRRPAPACARGSAPRSSPPRARRPGARAPARRCRARASPRETATRVSTTSPIASLTTSSKRDMCAPFCARLRSTKHSRRAKNSSSRMRTTFSTPVTPTRERPTPIAGVRAWTSVHAARRQRGCRRASKSTLPGKPSGTRSAAPRAEPPAPRPRSCATPRRYWYHSAHCFGRARNAEVRGVFGELRAQDRKAADSRCRVEESRIGGVGQ